MLVIGGAGFLYGYTALATRRAPAQPSPRMVDPQTGLRAGAGPTALAIAATTWLNPHVLLETVVVLGTAATTHDPTGQ